MMGQIRDQDHLQAYMILKDKMALKLTYHIIKFFALCSKLNCHKPMTPMFIDNRGDFISVPLFYFWALITSLSEKFLCVQTTLKNNHPKLFKKNLNSKFQFHLMYLKPSQIPKVEAKAIALQSNISNMFCLNFTHFHLMKKAVFSIVIQMGWYLSYMGWMQKVLPKTI